MAVFVRTGGIDTSDATATAKNIEAGYTAYVKGEKIVGTAYIEHGFIKNSSANISLGTGVYGLSATSNSNYALFGGGGNSRVNAYNSNLTRSYPTQLSSAGSNTAFRTTSYAMFYGGYLDAYNSSLTKSVVISGSMQIAYPLSASLGQCALFGGGVYSGSIMSTVKCIDNSLTVSSSTGTLSYGYMGAGANINSLGLFAGGEDKFGNTYYNAVDVFNSSLTKTSATALVSNSATLAGASNSSYAIFAGGISYPNSFLNSVTAYNSSLTRVLPSNYLKYAVSYLSGASSSEYAVFAGGMGASSTSYDAVNVYNTSLTYSTPSPLSRAKYQLAGTDFKNYIIFGGGIDSNSSSGFTDMDVYMMN